MSNVLSINQKALNAWETFNETISHLSQDYDIHMIYDYINVMLHRNELFDHLPRKKLVKSLKSLEKKVGIKALEEMYLNRGHVGNINENNSIPER